MAENNQVIPETNSTTNQEMTKFLIMMIASVVIMLIVSIVINYVVVENIITQKLSTIQINSEEVGDEGDSDEIQKGIIVDLGDFILNLCDENGYKIGIWMSQQRYFKNAGKLSTDKVEKFTAWLQEQYMCQLEDLSFRSIVGRYFRIYGKESK